MNEDTTEQTALLQALNDSRGDHPALTPVENPRLTFAALRAANIERLPMFVNAKGESQHSGADWSLNDWYTATSGELGELGNVLKKVRRGDFTLAESLPKIRQEISDVLIYLDLLARSAGITDLGEAVTDTFNAKSAQLELPLFMDANGPIHVTSLRK